MKLLSGSELAEFIKQRQVVEARRLFHKGKTPQLAIIECDDNPVISTYIRLKQSYGEEIGVSVTIHSVKQVEIRNLISQLNSDASVDGIIVQLPLPNPAQTDEIVDSIASDKDVDGLGKNAKFEPVTPTAIMWLLAGHNIDLTDKNILIIGQGRLVGSPLIKLLDKSSIGYTVANEHTKDIKQLSLKADIIISAAGQPGLLRSDMIKPDAVVVDAGTSSESGKIVGDVAKEVYDRDDLAITPVRGGVGPLTICTLFENVLQAATIG